MIKKNQNFHIIIPIAGNASRINNNNKNFIIKAFLKIGSDPIISHILYSIINSLDNINLDKNSLLRLTIVVNNKFSENNKRYILNFIEKIQKTKKLKIEFLVQLNQNGTGSVLIDVLNDSIFKDEFHDDDLFFIFLGDHPLIKSKTISEMINKFINSNNNILGIMSCFENNEDNQYGRLEIDQIFGHIKKIHEYSEYKSNNEISKINLCNGPISMFKFNLIKRAFYNYDYNKQSTKEIYLHSLLNFIENKSEFVLYYKIDDSNEALGANTFFELQKLENIFQNYMRKKFQNRNIYFEDINSVSFSRFTEIEDFCEIYRNIEFKSFVKIGRYSKINSFCSLGENLELGEDCIIKSYSIISNSIIGSRSEIGPFANINSDNIIGNNNIIGNFTEIKRSIINDNNKAKHFAYISNAKIGNSNNIGAGTIFCNFNGKTKNEIEIGHNNFIGANNSLIAPLKINNFNITGAGSVINKNIDSNKLVLARAPQIEKEKKN